ncbi:MAG: phosphotransferase [Candidatus Sericytochromatia bacterium]
MENQDPDRGLEHGLDHDPDHDRIRAILARIPGWRAEEAVIGPLGGLTNQNYRIDFGNEAFALRLGGQGTALLGIDRYHELAATEIAAAAGIGPEVFFADPVQDILVTRLIQGEGLAPESVSRPEVMAAVVDALRRCHASPAFPGHFSAFAVVRSYRDLALAHGVVLPPAATQALALMEELAAVLDPPAQLVPCHNDLLAGNFLRDQRSIRIIDWEYAGMGDVFFDLGNFAANQELDSKGLSLLLELYFGSVEPAALVRLRLMQAVSNLREAFWGYAQAGISRLDIDYPAYAGTYLARFLQAAQADGFKSLMRRL